MLNMLILDKINGILILYGEMYFKAHIDLINTEDESKGQKFSHNHCVVNSIETQAILFIHLRLI